QSFSPSAPNRHLFLVVVRKSADDHEEIAHFTALRGFVWGYTIDPLLIAARPSNEIDPTVSDATTGALRRICCRHLYANLKAKYHLTSEKFNWTFWQAAYVYDEADFIDAMRHISLKFSMI
ncbi:hypothetical protein Ancab_007647, partial [Ancistrocladus abbreviatus]